MKNENIQHNYDTEIDIRIEKCHVCENEVINPPKSKRLITCNNCAHFQKYGQSIFTTQQKKLRETQLRAREKAKSKPTQYKPKQKINFFSEKGKEARIKLSQTKREIWQEATNKSEWVFCVGCGRGDMRLENSHILSVAQRKDLENDKNNINLFCNSCHCKHESFEISQLLQLNCFEADMRYIYEKDSTKFNKVFFKLLDYCELNAQDKKALSILQKIERVERE